MSSQSTLKTTSTHVVLQGTAYEVGAAQARDVLAHPDWAPFFEEGKKFPNRPAVEESNRISRRFQLSLEEEVAGFCDTLKISPTNLTYYAYTHLQPRRCSHLVARPTATADGHTLMGRSYDFGVALDDLRMCTTLIAGKYAHIGFSSIFFGRHDGINEHGLAVTASVGGMPVGLMEHLTPAPENGFLYWAILRAMLEECRTVSEACELFKEMPGCGNPILLIADPSGDAAVAEGFGSHKSVRRVENDWVVAANHFTSPEVQPCNQRLMNNSFVRAAGAERYLENARGKIDAAGIKNLLGTPYPQGLETRYYEEFFGTLHSMVIDVTARSVDVTFGPPSVNPWRTFTFDDPRPGSYETLLPQEKADPSFWAPPV